jgi:hypothetical protein
VQISNSIEQDGVIDEEEFRVALNISNKDLSHRIFHVFDENSDGCINFGVRLSIPTFSFK